MSPVPPALLVKSEEALTPLLVVTPSSADRGEGGVEITAPRFIDAVSETLRAQPAVAAL